MPIPSLHISGINRVFPVIPQFIASNIADNTRVSIPSSIQNNDFAVAIALTENDTTADSVPSGWTNIFQSTTDGSYDVTAKVWYRTLTSSDAGTLVPSPASSGQYIAGVSVYRRVSSLSASGTTSTGGSAISSISAPSLSYPSNSVAIYPIIAEDPSVTGFPSNTTTRENLTTSGPSGNWTLAWADEINSSSGTTGTKTFTVSSTDDELLTATIILV